MTQDIRWQQRFENYQRALALLREPFEGDVTKLSALERSGVIQRFEVTLELGWKTMKDYLEFDGHVVEPSTVRVVIKEAAATALIPDGALWLEMVENRNRLSHAYDGSTFEEAVLSLRDRWLGAFDELQAVLAKRRDRS